jgi:hypothetical protein
MIHIGLRTISCQTRILPVMTFRSSSVWHVLLLPLFFLVPILPLAHTSIHAEVVINEVFPKTDDISKEWIELYNNGTEPVSLDRWKLENTSGDTKIFSMNASSRILAHDFLIFYQTQTAMSFNKEGDTVRLVDENNNLIDSQGYQGILGYNMSVGRSSDGGGSWVICTTRTPNKPNNCPAPTITPIPLPTEVPPTPLPTETPAIPPTPTLVPIPTIIPTTTIDMTRPEVLSFATSSGDLGTKQHRFLVIAGMLIGIVVVLGGGVGVFSRRYQRRKS